jgi:hypothetical protein
VLIRTKLTDGRLPLSNITRFWCGNGNGERCDACEEIVAKDDLVLEGAGVEGSRPLRLHFTCIRLWDEERSAFQNIITDPVCTVCRKSVVRLPVHEGKQLFHLDCYVTYKRRAMPPTLPQPERRLPA